LLNFSTSLTIFEVEQILPISKGGKTVLISLAFSGAGGYKTKSRRIDTVEPKTGKTALLCDPRRETS